MTIEEFINTVIELPRVRPGPDWHEGESDSMICLDLLLNQRVGVERASAVACAVHDHFRRPLAFCEKVLADVCQWPYAGIKLRSPAKSLLNMIARYLGNGERVRQLRVSELPSFAIGSLASLERYNNRTNRFFDPVWAADLTAEEIRSLTPEAVHEITGIKLPEANQRQQLCSVVEVLNLRERCQAQDERLRSELLRLPRVGQEAADTLMVYLFHKPALIVDEYLRRIAYRHNVIEGISTKARLLRTRFDPHIQTEEVAYRFHSRIDDIGVMFCLAVQPLCERCPLARDAHRI